MTPIVSEPGSKNSTSANVHLYADPSTFLTDNPILYVDSEGLGGGARPTELHRDQISTIKDDEDSDAAQGPVRFNPLKIHWPEKTDRGTSLSRKDVVRTLFPRLLYIFSNVVVYVVHNRK